MRPLDIRVWWQPSWAWGRTKKIGKSYNRAMRREWRRKRRSV